MSTRFSPDYSRVSVLTAMVLLTYALTPLIKAPHSTFEIVVAGINLVFAVNLNTAIAILAAGLTATGMDWLLRAHPSLQPGESKEHWLLPTLTTLILGITLYTLPAGTLWWMGFGIGGILLVAVFLAEFVVVDPTDTRYPLATAGLTGLSFTLYLVLSVALRAAGVRLFLLVPALFLASGLVALRTLHLRLNEQWEFAWAAGIALIATQLGASLHYWPLTPLQYGLLLLGPVYALTELAASLKEGNPFHRAVVEPAVMLAIVCGMTIWFH